MSPPNTSDADSQSAAKRIACIECRQQKVRCDAHEKWPHSCSRCTKKKTECKLQPEFKRTSKRRRLAEVEQEMADLKRSLEIQESEKRRIVSGSLLDLGRGGPGGSSSATPVPGGPSPRPLPFSAPGPYGASSPIGLNGTAYSPSPPQVAPPAPVQGPAPTVSTKLPGLPRPLHSLPAPVSNPATGMGTPILNPTSSAPTGAPGSAGYTGYNGTLYPGPQNGRAKTASAGTNTASTNAPVSNATTAYSRSLPEPTFIPREFARASDMQLPTLSQEAWQCTAKTIEDLTLSPDTIRNLFTEFIQKYHPFMPVVDLTRGPDKIFQLSPALFWTIMAVASRRYDRDRELMHKLAPVLKTCLSEITISPVTRFAAGSNSAPIFNVASVYSVQAFLIYTMWPPLTSSISADSSWNMAGIAIFSAIRVGLHCPGYARDFGRIKADNPIYPKISEQIRTWVCCNVVSQTLGTVFGFPSFTSFDASVISACQQDSEIDIPDQIRQMMSIQQIESEIEKTLNTNLQDPLGMVDISERLSLIQLLARKLDTLELNIGSLDDIRRFGLLAARVHLMSYYFMNTRGIAEFEHQKGMVQAYNSSLALMDHAEAATKRNRHFIKYLPGAYVQTLWQTTAIVTRIYHSSHADYIDLSAGRRSFRSSVHLISRASIMKHDMAYRAAEIMAQLWQIYSIFSKRGESTTKLSVRTRMAASVFFDSLWAMREECGIRSDAPTILDQRNNDDEEDSGQSRPLSASGIKREGTTLASAPVQGIGKGLSVVAPKEYPPPIEPKPASPANIGTPGSNSGSVSVPVAPGPTRYHGDSPILGGASTNSSGTPAGHSSDAMTPRHEVLASNALGTSELNSLLDWDADMIFRDVDLMMADFGFRAEEVATL